MGEMGMSAQDFWDMPPFLFALKAKGYRTKEDRHAIYARKQIALHYNQFQVLYAKSPQLIAEQEVFLVYGEKKTRKVGHKEADLSYTEDEILEIQNRMKLTVQVEVKQDGS